MGRQEAVSQLARDKSQAGDPLPSDSALREIEIIMRMVSIDEHLVVSRNMLMLRHMEQSN